MSSWFQGGAIPFQPKHMPTNESKQIELGVSKLHLATLRVLGASEVLLAGLFGTGAQLDSAGQAVQYEIGLNLEAHYSASGRIDCVGTRCGLARLTTPSAWMAITA